ncbi:MAG: hypothetical protein WCW27_00285 [Patescibacteria group bacterium]|jgi:3D (Asp-Asp-Asp) domain-containing protein
MKLPNKFTKTIVFLSFISLFLGLSAPAFANNHTHEYGRIKKVRLKLPPLPLLSLPPLPVPPEPKPIRTFTSSLFAYSSTVDQTDGDPFTTASGAKVADGIVATNCLPFGTKIKIPSLFPDKTFIVQDRMAAWHGCNSIDIWFPSRQAAFTFGKQVALVEVY